MKIQYQLWLIYSTLFIIVSISVFVVISNRYEKHLQTGYEQLTITQGVTMLDRLKDTYPYTPNRSMGYLRTFSNQLNTRLIILDQEKRVYADSFGQLSQEASLNISILQREKEFISEFYNTQQYGYVQYTLVPFVTELGMEGYLLMIGEADQLYNEINSFQYWIIQMLIIAVTIFFIVSYFISNWFSTPIRKIILQLKKITPQKRSFTLKYKRKDEIKKLIDAIKNMVEEMNLYDERQRRFLSTSSHELKTPLATMQLILENLPYVREEEGMHTEFVQDLFFEVNKMKKMVEQLIEINRIWDKPLEIELVTDQDLKKHIQQSFQYIAESKNIVIEYELDTIKLYVDKTMFLRGLDNIVSNAIRYSTNNQLVKIRAKNLKEETQISIIDKGIGIAREDVQHIFEPFYRSNDATIWNQEGSGLGLHIVKQMVEMHKGRVEIDTEKNKGTTVHLFLKKPK
ncbi:signal transduction histidine kinase [Natranaerovirga pectinivora]|uniref:histidine kinase n=1 Tax=Natranaerovirga pectinivora TaxID=682400 RepID=A0A4R3MMC3_9FIRM|nr:HAMP domain-containing sensor histidine kinase [Natranaerovirga pectinivora]TCT16085.1 signal transduction histidine kinase [Natranaerovirga pectinivora]